MAAPMAGVTIRASLLFRALSSPTSVIHPVLNVSIRHDEQCAVAEVRLLKAVNVVRYG